MIGIPDYKSGIAVLQCITQANKWREIGENARKTVERDHEINSNAKRMLGIYEVLMKG